MKQILPLLLMAAMILCVGCKREEPSARSRNGGTGEDPEARRARVEREKDELLQETREKLAEADRRIAELEAKAKDAPHEERREYRKEIDNLRQKEISLRDNLETIKNAGLDAWEDLKPRLRSALNELTAGLARAITQFRFSGPTPGPSRERR